MHVEAAVARKLEAGASAAYEDVKRSALSAIERISQAGFGAVVFDLDGTLVGSGPRREIAAQLARLSEYGIRLAIATGRGASETTRNLLQSLIPSAYWGSVLIGYHNGAEVSSLQETSTRHLTPLDPADRRMIYRYLGNRREYRDSGVTIKEDDCQITLRSATSEVVVQPQHLFAMAQEAIAAVDARAKAVCSTHSIDIVSVHTSKNSIAALLDAELRGLPILRMGDSGAWPGNDFELLSHEYGLSVAGVSADLNSCWNLLPPGTAAVDGALFYLQRLRLRKGTVGVRFDASQ